MCAMCVCWLVTAATTAGHFLNYEKLKCLAGDADCVCVMQMMINYDV